MKNFIVLEGISGSGKSTLQVAINEARHFQDYHIHRFTATEWVYATLYRRPVELEKLRHFEEALSQIFNVTLVTLTCDPWQALARKQQQNDLKIEENIAIANKLFVVYHNYLTVFQRKVIVNTSCKDLTQCVDIILRRVEAPWPNGEEQ